MKHPWNTPNRRLVRSGTDSRIVCGCAKHETWRGTHAKYTVKHGVKHRPNYRETLYLVRSNPSVPLARLAFGSSGETHAQHARNGGYTPRNLGPSALTLGGFTVSNATRTIAIRLAPYVTVLLNVVVGFGVTWSATRSKLQVCSLQQHQPKLCI